VFLAGGSGTGKSHLLESAPARLAAEVDGVRVANGSVVSGRYVSGLRGRSSGGASPVLGLLSTSVSLAQPALGPAIELVVQLAELGGAAREVVQGLASDDREVELADLLARLLRAVATEESGRPLVCLVDDADQLGGSWWVSLQFAFAQEIDGELPLVLVLGIDGPEALAMEEDVAESAGVGVARSLVKRNLADWRSLGPLDEDELIAWLGPMPETLARRILANAGSSPAEVAPLWDSLRKQGIVLHGDSGWRSTGPLRNLDYHADALTERISAQLRSTDAGTVEAAREVLACAALEGDVFTAEAVAAACGRDRDEVVDLLDDLSIDGAPSDGVVEELGAIEIEDLTREDSHHLWRYRFLRPLDRQVARKLIGDKGELIRIAALLAGHLARLYSNEVVQAAPVIARLYSQAGDTDSAARFHSLAYQAASHSALRLQCDLLLRADTDAWTEWDYRDASDVLLRACKELEGTWPLAVARELAERAETFARSAGSLGVMNVAWALQTRGRAEIHAGRREQAKSLLEEALRRTSHGSPMVHAYALMDLGILALYVDPDLTTAENRLEESLALMRRLHFRIAEGGCLYVLAEIAHLAEDDELALKRNDEALRIARGEGIEEDVASCSMQRGHIAHGRGEYDAARGLALSALEVKRKRGKRNEEATCLRLLGSIDFSQEDYRSACSHSREALAISLELGDLPAEAEARFLLAGAAGLAGEVDEARAEVERAAQIHRSTGSDEGLAECARLLDELDELG
jgi:tetratricopeptide (TPR) repeat protein